MNAYIKDFGWFILKDNFFVNFVYYIIYRFWVKKNQKNKEDSQCINKMISHPAYKNFSFANNATTNKKFIIDNNGIFLKNKGLSFTGHTSGTTNTPISVYRSIPSILFDELSLRSHWYSVGVKFNPKIATLRGDNLFDGDHSSNVYWKRMPFTGRLIISSFHLSNKTADLYLNKLDDFKPDIILAYPSVIKRLSQFALEKGWAPSWKISGVFTSGEFFSYEDQTLVRNVFPCLFDHYGQAERVARLQQCEFGNYHVVEWYSKVEFEYDKIGLKIIGSNFRNKSMPLYRYDCNDYVDQISSQDNICSCNLESRYVGKIYGRTSEVLELPSGVVIGPAALSLLFYEIDGILEAQVIQKLDGSILIKYTTNLHTPEINKLERLLHQSFFQRFGKINLKIERSANLKLANSGKLAPIVLER